ncbi:hypothetical protein MRX96_047269, partial [Rhipicephalus microplus]
LRDIFDDLEEKDAPLPDFNKRFADLIIQGAVCVEQFTAALEHHKIPNTMRRVHYLLNSVSKPADTSAPRLSSLEKPNPKESPLHEVPNHRCELPYRS